MLNLKQISSLNVDLIPFSSDNFHERFANLKICLEVGIENNSDDLIIFCVQNVYAYRTGIIGWFSTLLSSKLSEYYNPTFLKTITNINANDFDILSGFISLISRGIPVFNFGIWDNKKFNRNIFKYGYGFGNDNNSIPYFYDLKSNYLLNPFFDSGCAIYSNKIPFASGFEKWNSCESKYYNNGIIWCYFRDENKGIMVFNLCIDKTDNFQLFQLIQLCELKNSFEKKYSENLEKYETYICGEFNIEFGISNIIPEINDKLNLLKTSNMNIFSNEQYGNTNHIFYCNNNINNFKTLCTKIPTITENYFTTIEMNLKKNLSPKNIQIEIKIKNPEQNEEQNEEQSKIVEKVENKKIEESTRSDVVENSNSNPCSEIESPRSETSKSEKEINVNNLVFNSETIVNYFKHTFSDEEKSEEEWMEVI
jgi:hypothetical protein